MSNWAHMVGNSVIETTDIDPVGRYHPSLVWVPCGPDVMGGWTYNNGTFAAPVEAPAPPPTAADILAGKIAAGLAVTCTGDASVSSTYALDAQTMDQIGSVARDAASGLGLPTGAPTFTYPDLGGIPRTFTADRLISLYKAQRDVLFRVNTAAAILANGGAPSWPDQTATIP